MSADTTRADGEIASEPPVAHALELLMTRLPSAFAVTRGEEHTLLFANEAFRTLLAPNGEPLRLGTALGDILDRSFRAGTVARNVRVELIDERAQPLICNVWPELGANNDTERLVVELRVATNAELTLEIQREVAERLLVSALREHDSADAADAARRKANFLAQESRRLAESLDEAETLAAMQGMSLPYVGDWCIVDTLDDASVMSRLAVIHPDPAKQTILEQIEGRGVPGVDDEPSLPAMLTVPLIIRERFIGAVTFVSGRHDRPFSADDIQLAEDLASRSATALDRARAYGEAITLKLKAESASNAKSTFLSMMSHELRTPLNAIGGYVDLIDLELHGPVTTAQHVDLARIRSNQRYLMGLISDLLNLTRVDSGQLEYIFGDVDTSEMLNASVALVEPLIGQRQLTFVGVKCGPGICARGDREKVIQILVNLLSNSIKFTPPGGRIGVECEESDHTVFIRVIDTGIGIPSGKLQAIFEPFVQVKGGSLGPESGVGLGLSISRSLARDMKGELSVESELGAGSRFTLSLPSSSSVLRLAE